MVTEIWINIGSGNGLLPDGTKPLPEPMLSYLQRCFVASHENNFIRNPMNLSLIIGVSEVTHMKLLYHRGKWVNLPNPVKSLEFSPAILIRKRREKGAKWQSCGNMQIILHKFKKLSIHASCVCMHLCVLRRTRYYWRIETKNWQNSRWRISV